MINKNNLQLLSSDFICRCYDMASLAHFEICILNKYDGSFVYNSNETLLLPKEIFNLKSHHYSGQ